jgi:hypothetical protein
MFVTTVLSVTDLQTAAIYVAILIPAISVFYWLINRGR